MNYRQNIILDYISQDENAKRFDIENYIANVLDKVSKATILRDLDYLIREGYIVFEGRTKNTIYNLKYN